MVASAYSSAIHPTSSFQNAPSRQFQKRWKSFHPCNRMLSNPICQVELILYPISLSNSSLFQLELEQLLSRLEMLVEVDDPRGKGLLVIRRSRGMAEGFYSMCNRFSYSRQPSPG